MTVVFPGYLDIHVSISQMHKGYQIIELRMKIPVIIPILPDSKTVFGSGLVPPVSAILPLPAFPAADAVSTVPVPVVPLPVSGP